MTRFRKRRAVSEIVSTLLLIAIVVSLGVIVFTFASSSLGSLTGGFTNLMVNQGNAVSENYVVEQVSFTFSGTPGATVYVRDVGASTVSIVSIYVVAQTTGAFVLQYTPSPATQINVGAFAIFSPTAGFTFTPVHGYAYSFTVTSSLGNSVIYYAKAN